MRSRTALGSGRHRGRSHGTDGSVRMVGMGAVDNTAAATAVVIVGEAGEGRHAWWRDDCSLSITTD